MGRLRQLTPDPFTESIRNPVATGQAAATGKLGRREFALWQLNRRQLEAADLVD